MKKRSWTTLQLKKAVANSTSLRQVIKKLGLIPAGGNYTQVKRYIKESNLDTSHFKGKAWNKGLTEIGKPIIPLSQILVKNSTFQSYKLKQRLFKEGIKRQYCEECGWCKKNAEGYSPLELDHINGNRHDNRLSNLRILCPNCHSLKPTHRGKNKGKRPGGEIGRRATLKML